MLEPGSYEGSMTIKSPMYRVFILSHALWQTKYLENFILRISAGVKPVRRTSEGVSRQKVTSKPGCIQARGHGDQLSTRLYQLPMNLLLSSPYFRASVCKQVLFIVRVQALCRKLCSAQEVAGNSNQSPSRRVK